MTQHENHGGDEECTCVGHVNGDHDDGENHWCCKCADDTEANLKEFARLYVRNGKLTDSIHRPVSDEECESNRQDLIDAGGWRKAGML